MRREPSPVREAAARISPNPSERRFPRIVPTRCRAPRTVPLCGEVWVVSERSGEIALRSIGGNPGCRLPKARPIERPDATTALQVGSRAQGGDDHARQAGAEESADLRV